MQAREETTDARALEVWDRLDRVMDPELDEAITEMGFVEGVAVDGQGRVEVQFRLPTYWCSPNFAFLMAEGIRREAGALPWVAEVRVRLEDHLCAEEMNAAVNAGRSFSDAFALNPELGDLEAVREKFDRKAFQRRQESVLLALRAAGYGSERAAAFTLGELDLLAFDDPGEERQRRRYREILAARGLARGAADHAFPDLDGAPLTVAGYAERMGELRAVRINMEFGGALCRGLKEHRYKEAVTIDGEPTLVDFIAGRVPPRDAAP
jgi:metal-sulfur cluster biosynthetic enzyme